MHTEITETIKGYVFYDDACPICRRWIRWLYGPLLRRGLHPVPLQVAWAKNRLGLVEGEPLREMKFLAPDGNVYGGSDALVEIARTIWWLWPLFALGQVPGAKGLLRKAYTHLAANRPCDDGICKVPKQKTCAHRHISSRFFEMP